MEDESLLKDRKLYKYLPDKFDSAYNYELAQSFKK